MNPATPLAGNRLWIALIVFLAVILPRAVALGDFPWLDDGYHVFIAQTIQQSYAAGHGFPKDLSGFKLFELLFFWVWQLPGNPFFWLRLADLLAAALAGWLFCRLMVAESKSLLFGLLIAFAGLCGLNLPGAIQSGFKHSFFPAFACLFGAMLLADRKTDRMWFLSGGLTALAVLFRETFFPFALLGCLGLLLTGRTGPLLRYISGGICATLAVTGLSALARGQLAGIFAFYFKYGQIYGPESSRRLLKFTENGGRALLLFAPLLALFAWALAILPKCSQAKGARLWFWAAAALLPLAEPLLKIGFLYHFSVCIPGICGFCACAYSQVEAKKLRAAFVWLCVCAALVQALELGPHFAKTPVTLAVLKNWPDPGWPESLADKSTTLEAARAIRELAPHGTAASTGFAYFVLPASGLLPPEPGLGDLSRAWIYSGYDPAKFRARLDRNQPDIVLIAHTESDHSAIFEKELKSVFDNHPDYRLVQIIPLDKKKNYGWLGYSIYKRKAASGG